MSEGAAHDEATKMMIRGKLASLGISNSSDDDDDNEKETPNRKSGMTPRSGRLALLLPLQQHQHQEKEKISPRSSRSKSSENVAVKMASPRSIVVESRRRLSARGDKKEEQSSPSHSPRQSAARRPTLTQVDEDAIVVEPEVDNKSCPLDDLSSSKNLRIGATDDDVDDFFKLK